MFQPTSITSRPSWTLAGSVPAVLGRTTLTRSGRSSQGSSRRVCPSWPYTFWADSTLRNTGQIWSDAYYITGQMINRKHIWTEFKFVSDIQSAPFTGMVLPHRSHLDWKAHRHLRCRLPTHPACHAFRSQECELRTASSDNFYDNLTNGNLL